MPTFKIPENKTTQEIEKEILSYWKSDNTFEKSVDKNHKDNLYVFYDGPPFISGLPHYGHLLGSIAKDVIPRYWTMRGRRVERVWGWDAHGLTVENKVQKKLGIKNRREIEEYGLEKFIKECYVYTSETSAEWPWYVDRIGRWVDMEHSYKTIDRNYMESVIWVFKQLYDKKLIYRGIRTSLFCPVCGTPVSNFEIAMDNSYKEYEDPAITVKFPVITKGKYENVNILAWTTTPWTIPSNRALVIKEDELYAIIEYEGEKYCIAKPRLEEVFHDKDYRIESELMGKELIGLEYRPPYSFYKQKKGEFKVYSFEGMVTMEDGTGVVHSAPGFGEIDTEMGRHYGLTIMLTIDDEGKFIEGNSGKNPFKDMFYQKANPYITQDLKDRGILFEHTSIKHRVPYHDRCDTLLIQKAQSSWFINVAKLKSKLLKNNKKINWVPEHIKSGRFPIGIQQAPDWCISRSRFWATPMPIWQSEDGDTIVIGSVKELEDLSGQQVTDLHRPYIDSIKIVKNGRTYTRIPEVLDSWFEAGSMPYAQIHYPFENADKFENSFPGDYIAEYTGQVRAWFYVMHVLSTALFNSHSFKNVIVTGVMAGRDGRKMSKTYQNYTDPREVLENIGGDALRLYLMGSPLMVAEDANFDLEALTNKLKNVINPLWNSAKFFLTYASQYDWVPENNDEFSDNPLDIWILTKLNMAVKGISESIESYTIPEAEKLIESFVDDLSRWYIRRARTRISAGEPQALKTAYRVLLEFSKAAAPMLPFISEKIYLNLTDSRESVHLQEYPKYNKQFLNKNRKIIEKMDCDRNFVTEVLSMRTALKIPVRQPLQRVITPRKVYFKDVVSDELNIRVIKGGVRETDIYVKDSRYSANTSGDIFLDTKITEKLKLEGLLREFTRKIQGLRKESNFTISDGIKVYYPKTDENNMLISKFGTELKQKLNAYDFVPSDEYRVTSEN